MPDLLAIVTIGLLLFGAKRLPELRNGMNGGEDEKKASEDHT